MLNKSSDYVGDYGGIKSTWAPDVIKFGNRYYMYYALTAEFGKGKSVIGIKAPYHGDKHAWLTEVDDVFIYSRAMTANEIRNRYLKLKKGGAKDILPYEISLSGVDTGDGRKCNKMEALLDFSSLPDADMKLLEKGKLTADWKLVSPSGKTSSGKWTFKNIQEVI